MIQENTAEDLRPFAFLPAGTHSRHCRKAGKQAGRQGGREGDKKFGRQGNREGGKEGRRAGSALSLSQRERERERGRLISEEISDLYFTMPGSCSLEH